MGNGDDKGPRSTREFDPARLAILTKQPLPDDHAALDEAPPIAIGRAATLDDPMTTGLLAEVARRSQTTEFDDEMVNEVLGQVDTGETNHPHTLRRAK